MRLPFVTDTKSRDGVSDKDSRLTNALIEDGKAVARPGIRNLTSVTVDTGKGLVEFGGKVISVFGQTCYMGGSVAEKLPIARTTIPTNYYGAALVRKNDSFVLSIGGTESAVAVAKVYKTTDGGATWTLLTSTPGWAASSAFIDCAWDGTKFVYVSNSGSYVSGPYEVWNSTNGSTWTKVVSDYWSSLESEILPVGICADVANGITYAVFRKQSSNSCQLWKSTNSGATWVKVKNDVGVYSASGGVEGDAAEGDSCKFFNGKIYLVGFYYNQADYDLRVSSRFMYELDPATSGTARLVRLPQVLVDDIAREIAGTGRKFENGWLGLFEYQSEMYLFAQDMDSDTGEYHWLHMWKYEKASSAWTFVAKYPSYYVGAGVSNMGITTIVQVSNGLLQLPYSPDPALDELAGKVIKYRIPSPSSVGSVSGDYFDFVESAT